MVHCHSGYHPWDGGVLVVGVIECWRWAWWRPDTLWMHPFVHPSLLPSIEGGNVDGGNEDVCVSDCSYLLNCLDHRRFQLSLKSMIFAKALLHLCNIFDIDWAYTSLSARFPVQVSALYLVSSSISPFPSYHSICQLWLIAAHPTIVRAPWKLIKNRQSRLKVVCFAERKDKSGINDEQEELTHDIDILNFLAQQKPAWQLSVDWSCPRVQWTRVSGRPGQHFGFFSFFYWLFLGTWIDINLRILHSDWLIFYNI